MLTFIVYFKLEKVSKEYFLSFKERLYFELFYEMLQTENYDVEHLKLRGHQQNFFRTFNAMCCIASTREKSQVAPHSFKITFVVPNMAKCYYNAATKSNRFDSSVVLQQEKYFFRNKMKYKFSMTHGLQHYLQWANKHYKFYTKTVVCHPI